MLVEADILINSIEKHLADNAKITQRVEDKHEELYSQLQSTNTKMDKITDKLEGKFLETEKHESHCKLCNLMLKQEMERFCWETFISLKNANSIIDIRIEEKKEKASNSISTKTTIILNIITILGAILGSTILKFFLIGKGS